MSEQLDRKQVCVQLVGYSIVKNNMIWRYSYILNNLPMFQELDQDAIEDKIIENISQAYTDHGDRDAVIPVIADQFK